MSKLQPRKNHWVVCVDNAGFAVSLERGKLYGAVADRAAAAEDLIRVIDESGEDYLYPSRFFVPIRLPAAVQRALRGARRKSSTVTTPA
jgi:hypothetical protein